MKENSFSKIKKRPHFEIYTISNSSGMRAHITNYGLRILSLYTPDKNGSFDDVVLGFNSIDDYKHEESLYFGCIVGQYANRIENGSFLLNGEAIQLEVNNGNNHLHGGSNGYHQVNWTVTFVSTNSLEFEYFFEEKEHHYPGNTKVKVCYEITEDNELIFKYTAQSDKDTILNLTNHSFFNLAGEHTGTIENHLLEVYADSFLTVNSNLIPTSVESVKNTPFDFRTKALISDRLNSNDDQLKITNGFDHCYVLKNSSDNKLVHAATLEHHTSGRIMKVFTTEPGIQFYTGNFLSGELKGKSGKSYQKHAGLCLETQKFPNSPNQPKFPSPFLKANEKFTSKTIYQFSIKN